MATAPEEMEDLSSIAGGLLVNFGTIQNLVGMLGAGTVSIHLYTGATCRMPLIAHTVYRVQLQSKSQAGRLRPCRRRRDSLPSHVRRGAPERLASNRYQGQLRRACRARKFHRGWMSHPHCCAGAAAHLRIASPPRAQVQAKGVDSVGPGFADPVTFVRNLARKERT